MEVELHLEAKEFEYIMSVLAQRPFIEVNQLMQKLVAQANMPRVATEPTPDR
jgi:hypothetical protein